MHILFAQAVPDTLINVSQLGIAGLMGALWWWERKYSHQREDQLTEAHQEILQQREHLNTLLDALQQNTRAIDGFTAAHQELVTLLRPHVPGLPNSAAAPPAPLTSP